MNVVRGRVRGGRVETDEELPEGSEVVIVLREPQGPFDLAAADEAELADRIESAERGDVEPAEALFARIRARAHPAVK